MIRVANAPCSWGVLEFETTATTAPAAQVLDEMAAAGYAGTELGDWGFLPTESRALAAEMARRGLALAGAFVPVDREARVAGYESWWDVPVAEVSATPEVQAARAAWEEARRRERDFL